MIFSRLPILVLGSIGFLFLAGCSSDPDLESIEPTPSASPSVIEEIVEESVVYDSVFDIPGVSESTWSVVSVSELVDGSTQFLAAGQVITVDPAISDASFKIVSGSSVEIASSLIYDGVTYPSAARVISSGECLIEVVDSLGSVLFSFTVVS